MQQSNYQSGPQARPQTELQSWKLGSDISFSVEDFDVLDIVLHHSAELRVCAAAVVRARALQVKFPIAEVADFVALLAGDKRLQLGGHTITEKLISKYVREDWLPIWHEGDLVSACHLALLGCSEDAHFSSKATSIKQADEYLLAELESNQ